MDLRGKPSTFSAEGTEKLVVGEDGLDGGSLVSMMTRMMMMDVGYRWRRSEDDGLLDQWIKRRKREGKTGERDMSSSELRGLFFCFLSKKIKWQQHP